jgi:hypothetical protein
MNWYALFVETGAKQIVQFFTKLASVEFIPGAQCPK